MFQSQPLGILLRVVLTVILFAAADFADAATIIVTTIADAGPGSLRDTIASSASGDTIAFAPGLSGATILLTGGQITLSNSLTLDASPLAAGITIDGHTNGRIFQITGSAIVLLDSLAITNGKDTGNGGGINNQGALTLNRCAIAGNSSSSSGGGVFNNGTLTVSNCTVSGNAAAADGGGINSVNGGATINQSTLSGNSAASSGGGIYSYTGLTLNQCTVSSNTASQGGGVFSHALMLMNQCTVAGNKATSPSPANSGGGIFDANAAYFQQCTVVGNQGGGLLVSSSTTSSLYNSIVVGNDYNISVISGGLGSALTYSGVNITDGDPMLAPLGNYGGPTQTMPPLLGSPAIDASTNTPIFTTDQRGFPRLSGLYVDIGAVESAYPAAAPLVVTQPATDITTNHATLNATVTQNGAATAAYFQYGTTTNYGLITASKTFNVGTASMSNTVANLSPATIYYFRAVGTNSAGTTFGNRLSFHTGGITNIVTNTNDNGPGSLRDAIQNFVIGDSPNIVFATNLAGSSILLTSGQITITKSLGVDASTLPGGVTIDGHTNGRVFEVLAGNQVLFDSLTITKGMTDFNGAGIRNQGTLTLNNCRVSGNSAGVGGGIENRSLLTVNKSTVSGNFAQVDAGGILNLGTLTLNQSTLSGNSSGYRGGAIYQFGTLALNQCTLYGNSANQGGGVYADAGTAVNQSTLTGNYATNGGGGIYNAGWVTLSNSIVAGNTGASSPNFQWLGAMPTNIPVWRINITNGDPGLAPLGNYGGPTQTMPPLPGSPAVDACTNGTIFSTDQRGFPRPVDGNGDSIAVADIGAVEGFVYYGPGTLSGTKKLGNGTFQFGFPNYTNQSFTVFATTNIAAPLNTWSNLGPAVETPPGSGQYQFTDLGATNNPQRFYRVRSP